MKEAVRVLATFENNFCLLHAVHLCKYSNALRARDCHGRSFTISIERSSIARKIEEDCTTSVDEGVGQLIIKMPKFSHGSHLQCADDRTPDARYVYMSLILRNFQSRIAGQILNSYSS